MELHLKLCGFCNPMFDPGKILEELKKACPGCRFIYCDDPEKADLILNGCQTGCVQNSGQGRALIIVAGFSVNGKEIGNFQRLAEEVCSLLPV